MPNYSIKQTLITICEKLRALWILVCSVHLISNTIQISLKILRCLIIEQTHKACLIFVNRNKLIKSAITLSYIQRKIQLTNLRINRSKHQKASASFSSRTIIGEQRSLIPVKPFDCQKNLSSSTLIYIYKYFQLSVIF